MKKWSLAMVLWIVSLLAFTTQATYATPAAPLNAPAPVRDDAGLKYELHVPAGYAKATHKTFPLLVYLHGAGESGANLTWLNRHGPPKYVSRHPDVPFILFAPQAPRAIGWQPFLSEVQTLIDQIQAQYRVDPNRIYLTGNSMGGNGAWELARRWPDRFAAVVPVASFFDDNVQDLCALKHTAIWVIHGQEDASIAAEGAQKIVNALRACGLDPKLTLLPQTDHVATNEAYADPRFYTWLLAQKRR